MSLSCRQRDRVSVHLQRTTRVGVDRGVRSAKTRVEVSPFAVQGTARKSPEGLATSQKLRHQVEVFRRSETRIDRHDAQINGHRAFLDLLSAEVEEHVFTPPSAPQLQPDRDVRVRGNTCRFHRRVVVHDVNLLHLDYH